MESRLVHCSYSALEVSSSVLLSLEGTIWCRTRWERAWMRNSSAQIPYWSFSISRTIGIWFLMLETTRARWNSILEGDILPELRLEDFVDLSLLLQSLRSDSDISWRREKIWTAAAVGQKVCGGEVEGLRRHDSILVATTAAK